MSKTISLAKPDISEADIEAVAAVLRSGRLSCGPKLEEFESAVAASVGSRFAVGVSSGTAALHLCLMALGVGAGDEVITSPFSFVASANCILYVGAKPVFVDINRATLNLDPNRIGPALSPRTRAIVPVHVFGRPCEMEPVMETARQAGLHVLEDSCEALGARIGARALGTFGRAGVFAFYANKQITTGEGGMIVTDDEALAEFCKSVRNQGRGPDSAWLEHVRLGYNFRMTEFQAALGLSQLLRLGEFMAARARVASWYAEMLGDCEEFLLPQPFSPGTTGSWFVYVVQLRDEFGEEERNLVVRGLREQGIECSTYFPAIHLQPYFRQLGYKEGEFPVTEAVAARTIALPFHPQLSCAEVERVSVALKDLVRTLPRRLSLA